MGFATPARQNEGIDLPPVTRLNSKVPRTNCALVLRAGEFERGALAR